MSETSPAGSSSSPATMVREEFISLPGVALQPLLCPSCQHEVGADALNPEKGTAQCPHCYHVFGFSHDSATGQLRPEQLLPDGLEVLKLRSELDLRLRWMHTTSAWNRKFFILFTTLWNLILLPFVITVVVSGNLGILLFLSLHLLVGLGLIGYLAAIYVNTTEVSVTPDRVRISSGPIRFPFGKAREWPAKEVDQLYVSRYTAGTQNGSPRYAYALYAILKSGDKVSLLRGMNQRTQAYLEQEIESYLGIANRPVADEAVPGKR